MWICFLPRLCHVSGHMFAYMRQNFHFVVYGACETEGGEGRGQFVHAKHCRLKNERCQRICQVARIVALSTVCCFPAPTAQFQRTKIASECGPKKCGRRVQRHPSQASGAEYYAEALRCKCAAAACQQVSRLAKKNWDMAMRSYKERGASFSCLSHDEWGRWRYIRGKLVLTHSIHGGGVWYRCWTFAAVVCHV